MFKHFSKSFNNTQLTKNRLGSQNYQNINKHASKPFFFKLSKKFFLQGGNPFLALLPVTRTLVIGNCVMWGISWLYNQRDYITNFYYNKQALEKGKIHTAITSHFVKHGTLDFLIDTFILGMIANNIEMMVGSLVLQKLVLASALGSLALVHLTAKNDEFFKPDTFVRLVIYFMAVKDPHQLIYFFPLPIKLKIMYLAGFVGLLDIFSGKMCNFAPLIACIAMKGKGGF